MIILNITWNYKFKNNNNKQKSKGYAIVVKKNNDVREAVKRSGVCHWMIAERLGIADTTFSRWLRKELPPNRKIEILAVINELKQEIEN